jgi:isopentenyl diphosphate isomerase/L-lactate dehydrogenase-like FMN-dependent dehydrogenase
VDHFGDFQIEIYGRGMSGETPELPATYEALLELARERMKPKSFAYAAGGAGAERTMRDNVAAFDRWRLVPRMLRDVSKRDLSTEVLGTPLGAPLMLGPVGVLEIIHPDGELAVARAAAETGVGMILSCVSSTPLEQVAEALGDAPRWFQLYPPADAELGHSLVERAERAGYSAIVVTLDSRMMPWRPRDIDAAYLPFLEGKGIANYTSDPVFRAGLEQAPEDDVMAAVGRWAAMFPNPNSTWDSIDYVREATDLPVLVKGVLHLDDAREAVERGYDGVVVSNHGGRQVDGSIAALEALPWIVDAVPDGFTVLFDSGVRTGSDVLKAVALGARAALVARPWVWGLGLGGQAGVTQVLRGLLADLDLTMAMCGMASLADVGERAIVPAP